MIVGFLPRRTVRRLTAPIRPGFVTRTSITVPARSVLRRNRLRLTLPRALRLVNLLMPRQRRPCFVRQVAVTVEPLGTSLTTRRVNRIVLPTDGKLLDSVTMIRLSSTGGGGGGGGGGGATTV